MVEVGGKAECGVNGGELWQTGIHHQLKLSFYCTILFFFNFFYYCTILIKQNVSTGHI